MWVLFVCSEVREGVASVSGCVYRMQFEVFILIMVFNVYGYRLKNNIMVKICFLLIYISYIIPKIV